METHTRLLDAEQNLIDAKSFKYQIISLCIVFICFVIALVYIFTSFPTLPEEDSKNLKLPFSIEEARSLGLVLAKYKGNHYHEVWFGIALVYIFLQTFAIPGSLFLSILLGYLFDFYTAIITICMCSAVGATMCFAVSNFLGRRLVTHFFPEKVKSWAAQVQNHKDDLLSYIVVLRITPFLPNWFINLVAPIIGVPLFPFAFGTFIGVAPPSFIAIETGKTLYKLTSSSNAFSTKSITMMTVFTVVALLPVIFKRYFRARLN